MSRRHVDELLHAAKRVEREKAILTPDAARRVNLNSYDTLIRGTGGTGLIRALAKSKGVRSGKRRVIQVIDFIDHYDPRALKLTIERKLAYQHAGWLLRGTDLVEHRVSSFLKGEF